MNTNKIDIENFDFKTYIVDYLNQIIETENDSKSFVKKLTNMKKHDQYENVFTCFDRCLDNYVGKVDGEKFLTAEERYKAKDKTSIRANKNETNIVVLLESPHQDEFKKKLTAPALGETGERLDLYLEKLLKENRIALSNDNLFLVNAIQYQCSLGFPTNMVRNRIFNHLFEKEEFKNDLKDRIQSCHPETIIIATTSFCRENIKTWVLKEFEASGISIYETDTHPSVWNTKTKISGCN